jgi:hypothetical protein
MRRVGLIDITGRQRDAPRRIATFLHATLRVAPHRYATLEPLGKPGGSRAFSADALILGVVCFEVESRRYPTVSWSMNKDDEYRRNAAEAFREPTSIWLMALLRADERLRIFLLIGVDRK